MVRIILIILIIIGIGFFLWNISLNKEELNTKNLAPQSKNNEARSVLSPELGGKITFPSDAPTKNISTSTLTTLDVSYIFPDKAVHYAILKIPDATVNVRCDLSIIRAVVNRGTIRALRCYPIENKERQSINETRIIKNISGDFEIQNVTKNITAYYTTRTVQRINTATQRNYIIEFETEPFAQGFYNLSVGLFNFDPDISACGTLNSNDTVYTLTTDIIDSSSTCFTVDGVNITFDGQGHIVDGQKQTYTRGFHILANSKNFSLKNVVVRDWESGFYDDQSLGYHQINNVTFFNNTEGIATLNGKNNTIKNVIVRNSSGIGIKIFYGYPNYGNFYFENVTNELEYNGTEQKWHSEQVHNISSKHNRGWFPRLTSDGLDANTQANTAWYNGTNGGMNSDLTPNSSLKYWYNNQNITETGGGGGDDGPPQWFDNQTNSTIAGSSINHSIRWTDNTGLSGYIFSFDNGTGTFVNDSFVSFKGVQNFSNVVKIVNSTIGSLIRWRVYANDTSGNMNVTDIFSYVTTEQSGNCWSKSGGITFIPKGCVYQINKGEIG